MLNKDKGLSDVCKLKPMPCTAPFCVSPLNTSVMFAFNPGSITFWYLRKNGEKR